MPPSQAAVVGGRHQGGGPNFAVEVRSTRWFDLAAAKNLRERRGRTKPLPPSATSGLPIRVTSRPVWLVPSSSVAQRMLNVVDFEQAFVEFAPSRPVPGEVWRRSGSIWSTSPNPFEVGVRRRPKAGGGRPNVGRNRSKFGRLRANGALRSDSAWIRHRPHSTSPDRLGFRAMGAAQDIKIRIFAPPERKFSTWIGGSALAAAASIAPMTTSMQRRSVAQQSFRNLVDQTWRNIAHRARLAGTLAPLTRHAVRGPSFVDFVPISASFGGGWPKFLERKVFPPLMESTSKRLGLESRSRISSLVAFSAA